MQAIVIDRYGASTEFHVAAVPQPIPGDQEVLVRVRAISLNPIDLAGRQGRLAPAFTRHWRFPLVLGTDFAGVVASVGQRVTTYHVGQRVFGAVPVGHAANNGALGEVVAVPLSHVAPIPPAVSFDQAATLGTAAMAAYDGLVHQLQLRSGQTLLVQGGTGGVGLMAVQLAHHLGATVWATASAANAQLLTDLGVDHVIDYHRPLAQRGGATVDAVLDTVGDLTGGLTILKPTGRLVSLPVRPATVPPSLSTQQVIFQRTTVASADLAELARLVACQVLTIVMDVQPLTVATLIAATDQLAGHHTVGKRVLHVAPTSA